MEANALASQNSKTSYILYGTEVAVSWQATLLLRNAAVPAWRPVYDLSFFVHFKIELALFEIDIGRGVPYAVAERISVASEADTHTRVAHQTRTRVYIDRMVVGKFVGRIGVANGTDEGVDILPYPAVVLLNEFFMGSTTGKK